MSRIAIWMPEEFWINSQLSLARFSGGATIGGHQYIIVDKHEKIKVHKIYFTGNKVLGIKKNNQ